MTETKDKHEQLMEIGRNAFASIREMVAALECDWDRLYALRVEMEDAFTGQCRQNRGDEMYKAWLRETAEDDRHTMQDGAIELLALEAAAGECESREDAETRIQDDPLSIQFRGGCYAPGDEDKGGDAEEFEILLCTGGPAVRIMGEFGQGKAIHRVYLQVQDWFTPWTDYYEEGISDVLEAYCGVLSLDAY